MPDPQHLGILLILGVGVFGGILGAWLFQRLRIPQVIGYIAIGLLVGETGFGIINQGNLASMRPFTFMALAVIGFLVGAELEGSMFRKYGRQFFAIMMGEGLGAFFLVGVFTGILLFVLTHDAVTALAGAVVFGAIASATDPASTMDVLWEYRSKGVLTSSLVSVVALDDALAMVLYGLGTSVASMLAGGDLSLVEQLTHVAIDVTAAVVLGLLGGVVLNFILRHSRSAERSLTVTIGTLLLIAGVSLTWQVDVIIAGMSAGVLLVNLAPNRSKELFKAVRAFSGPVYVMFFVMVGARLKIAAMPWWVWGLVGLYVVGRTAGKFLGTIVGARISGSEAVVRNNLGLGLFAQGGVAVGLSLMAGQHLVNVEIIPGMDLGQVVVATVTATTLLVQIIGPPSVKFAITRADEIGRNVTEEDIIAELTVAETTSDKMDLVRDTDLLPKVFETVSRSEQLAFPVVDSEGGCTGVITLESLKELLTEHEIWGWMIAEDVMGPVRDIVTPSMPLAEALDTMRQLNAEQALVRDPVTGAPLSVFDVRVARRRVAQVLLQRQGL